MTQLPKRMTTIIPATELTIIKNWWERLDKEDQNELQALYDEQLLDTKTHLSIYLCGKFVEQERPTENQKYLLSHFYEYLINHELFTEHKTFVGSTCSAHKIAENTVKNGYIPINYKCPLNDQDCLMLKILNIHERRKGFRLFVRFKIV